MTVAFLTVRERELLAVARYLRNGIGSDASNGAQRRMLDAALAPYASIETPGIPAPGAAA